MERDIRQTDLFKEVEADFRQALEPGFGKISAAVGPVVSPHGRTIAFTGARMEKLEGSPQTRICTVPVDGGSVETITGGPHNDHTPRWSPDGTMLAFLSDRAERGQFQLYLLQIGRLGEAIATPTVAGTIEYFAWAPDGRSILLGVAGRGADLSGGQGSGTHAEGEEDLPSWLPTVDVGVTENQWRRIHLYDVNANTTRVLSRERLNVWEAAWASTDRIAAIVSEKPGEEAWYDAPLALIDVETGREQVLYRSRWQLGVPASSPSGRRIAVIQAVSSDRYLVAGDLLLIEPDGSRVTTRDTAGVDVTFLVWRDEDHLIFAGIRGFETVIGEYDAATGAIRELWTTRSGSSVYFPDYPHLSLCPNDAFVLMVDSYESYPAITLVQNGEARPLASLAHEGTEFLKSIGGTISDVSWHGRDGLEIQGLLVTPEGDGPHPLVVNVHGGPVFAYRHSWGYLRLARFLAKRGYATLFPNPRGSAGRGQEFAMGVYGEMGGEDTHDILTGVDALIERGIADPERIGVTGGSYGGFMTSWIITQTDRFAAAVSVAPTTDWYSFHWTSNIPDFDRLFLQDDPYTPGGKYFDRSPVMFAGRVKTPTLNIAGALDKCTPAGQAIEFHRALLENGVESALVIYPEEGHGVRQFPAQIDYTTRVIEWFVRHMPPGPKQDLTAADRPAKEVVGAHR